MVSKKNVIIIGSGFSGLSAACYLANAGFKVTVLEKNDTIGGRARKFSEAGFVFDMGPSWYWMPDVFEQFFNDFGKNVNQYYDLIRLDPSYSVFFGKDDIVQLPAKLDALFSLFENIEPGSSVALKRFLLEAKYKYEVGMKDFVRKPSHSVLEFVDIRLFKSMFKLEMFTSIEKVLRKHFKDERLLSILKFPVLFLGATPEKTPALYSLMNYADIELGTWYPKGGMFKIVEGMHDLALELGVEFFTGQEVKSINISKGRAVSATTPAGVVDFDYLICSADYHHCEQKLIPEPYRLYKADYWENRVMAPSSLLFYLGIDKKLEVLQHHNLFFDEDFSLHAEEIYEDPKWPSKPLFYACVPSKTDDEVAPDGMENLFLLMPVAPGLEDSQDLREYYYNVLMDRLESLTGQKIKPHVIFKKSYAHRNFVDDYHAFKGNAYGLANTLYQTAFLKPKIKNPKISNLLFTGQLTTPGPGMPPSIISGKVVAEELIKMAQKDKQFI